MRCFAISSKAPILFASPHCCLKNRLATGYELIVIYV